MRFVRRVIKHSKESKIALRAQLKSEIAYEVAEYAVVKELDEKTEWNNEATFEVQLYVFTEGELNALLRDARNRSAAGASIIY